MHPKLEQFLENNKKFHEALAPPTIAQISTARHQPGVQSGVLIVSCSDPRIIPEEFFGFGRGESAVIRNAGGRAVDALRSIHVLDALANLGTIIVVHHTDCGMMYMPDENVRKMLRQRAPDHVHEIDKMTFGEFQDVDDSLREDIAFLKADPLLARKDIVGLRLNAENGQLTEVK